MGDAPYEIRPIKENEYPRFWETITEAFQIPLRSEEVAFFQSLTVFGRTLAAFDGDQIAGTAESGTLELTLPGGPRPAAAVSFVTVHPDYRRQGVLSSLMARQFADLHEGGEPVAVLWASEAGIYRRFGYGPATSLLTFSIGRNESAYVPEAPSDSRLRVRTVDPQEAWPQFAPVYDAQVSRPGFFARDGSWWNVRLHDPEHRREPYGRLRAVTVEDDDGTRGYALYAVKNKWDDDELAEGELVVKELNATDPAAYAHLWRHFFDLDLVGVVHAEGRPLDDPLLHLVADPRRLRTRSRDGLWARLVDVDRALAQRAYATEVDVVIEVDDPVCPWNAGRWHLSGDVTGATCVRSRRPADVALGAQSLGGAYLGGTTLASAARAGLVRELHAGALAPLSRALAWDPLPWCPMDF